MNLSIRNLGEVIGVTAIIAAMCLGAIGFLNLHTTSAQMKDAQIYVEFNEEGELMRPEGYRSWPYIGTPVTPNDMNDGHAAFPEFHSVYMDPMSWDIYETTGEFPDGTVLIKELISVGSKEAASGNGYFMGDFVGLEAAIKDSERFADEPNYWAYFSFTNPDHSLPYKDKGAPFPAASCNECHAANAQQDMVFTQYYPVVRATREAAKNSR